MTRYDLDPIGVVASPLTDRADAPKQGHEGAPDAWIVLRPEVADGARELAVGAELLVFTWLHAAAREVLRVHPRGDAAAPERGVFDTRSPDRPNPIGLHQVRILAVEGARIRVAGLEAIDGTPVIDLKPVLRSPGVAGPARDRPQRVRDTLARLQADVDGWFATADPDTGTPHLVPLSLLWDDGTLWFATATATPTARNLQANPRLLVALGQTRDVVLVAGTVVRTVAAAEVDDDLGDRFAAATGFEPRELPDFVYLAVRPDRIQAWREEDELADRDLLRDGTWLA